MNRVEESRERSDEDDPGAAESDSSLHWRASGSFGVAWTAWSRGHDDLVLQGNWRSAFKPAVADFALGEEEEGGGLLDPETSTGVELGLKSRLRDGRVSLEIEAFQVDLRNLVVAQQVGGLPALVNSGSQRLRGVESSVRFRLPHDVSLQLGAAWHDPRFRDYVRDFGGVATQLAGKRLEMSARQVASLGLQYDPSHGFRGGVEVGWTGDRWLNMRNTALAPSYTTLAARAGWRFRRWELIARGDNLTDTRPPVAESELGDAQYYLLPARTMTLRASFSF